MADTDGLSAQSLAPAMKFNWIFLVELLVCGFVTLFFLFYFNRVFAKIISLVCRIYLRWKGLPHYIDIQSLQISLLAGRIFFGQVVYHGTNETITVVGGHITWRYWLRRVRHASVGRPGPGNEKSSRQDEPVATRKMEDLPCRVLLELKGLEWFIYNRSPAYDAILQQMAQGPPPPMPSEQEQDAEAMEQEKREREREDAQNLRANLTKVQSAQQHSMEKNSKDPLMKGIDDEAGVEDFEMDSLYLRMLPVKVECNRGAVVMGNNNVPSILVAHFDKADGVVDATRSRSIDKYKQMFNISFTHPVIQLKANADYKESLLSRGNRLLSNSCSKEVANSDSSANAASSTIHTQIPINATKIASADRQRMSRRQKLREIIPLFTQSAESLLPSETSGSPRIGGSRSTGVAKNQDKWMGLSRYLDDLDNDGWKFEPVEYAKFSTILDCPKADMSFYWDVPGLVPASSHSRTNSAGTSGFPSTNINGVRHPPPEWGIDLSFDGGTIHYGPWADRQRVHLQNMFFPRLYKSGTPATKLKPGQERVPTEFKLFMELNKGTILRIPIREESKDWKYKKRRTEATNDVSGSPTGEVRPFGWLEIKVAPESTISYTMAMIASKSGWKSGLNLELRFPEVRTSVNHDLLYKADWQGLECDLSSPLQWNGQCKWTFDNVSRGMRIFLLREHVTLMTDLVTDWAAGPLAEYATFQPFLYDMKLKLEDWEIGINVNDQNIIENPSSFEDNAFLMLKTRGGLQVDVGLDMTRFRPEESTVTFELRMLDDIVTPDPAGNRKGILELALQQPVWNTWNCFLKPPANKGGSLATVEGFVLKGRYNYFQGLGSDLIDTLELNVEGEKLKAVLLGVLIRYFLILRENYFGENLHFKTLDEWKKLHQPQTGDVGGGEVLELKEDGKSNDLDLILKVKVGECSLLLPKNLYEPGEGLRLDLPVLAVDLRFTNYYMDLQVDLSPISVSHGAVFGTLASTAPPKPQLFVDELTVYGHRLFGLPPTEPTYVCNWDLNIGDITGDCATAFLQASIFSLKAFIFGFEDVENALHAVGLPVIYDVTFIRIGVKSVKVWLHVDGDDGTAFRITMGELKFVLNDLANGKWSERIDLVIPGLTMACVDICSSSSSPMSLSSRRERSPIEEPLDVAGKKKPLGYVQTELKLSVFGRKREMARKRRLQMKHIRESDARTGRAAFLIRDDGLASKESSLYNDIGEQEPPSMSLPALPVPIRDSIGLGYRNFGQQPLEYDRSSRVSESSERKSSFLISSKDSLFVPSLRRTPSTIAPSFHSAMESLSDLPAATGSSSSNYLNASPSPNPSPMKPHGRKASTIGRSRFGSSSSSEERIRRVRSHSMLFSSAFVKPAFPLDGIELDLRDVPKLDGDVGEDEEMAASYTSLESFVDENMAQNSIVVDFTPGIKGYCTPMALKNVVGLLFSLQAKSPEDILDEINIGIVDRLAELTKQMSTQPTILEACVKIPHLKFCFANPIPESFFPSPSPSYRLETRGEEDVYIVELRQLMLAGRSKKTIANDNYKTETMTEAIKEKQVLSLHVLLNYLGITLNKTSSVRLNDLSAKPALGTEIRDIMFWASTNEASTASLQVKSIDSSLESQQIVFLYEVMQRTTIMLEELQQAFAMLGIYEKRRIQDLVYSLAAAGEDLEIKHDPTPLTRPSYVLRSSLDHVRVNDSWKINTRLQHVFQSLPLEYRNDLIARCENNLGHPPADAKKLAVDVFARWRSWELADIEHCFLIGYIFGGEQKPRAASPAGAMQAKVVLEVVRFLVDPGPKQHEILVDNLVMGISEDGVSKGITSESRAVVPAGATPATTMVHIHSQKIQLALEVLEIIESVSKFLSTQEKSGARTPTKSSVKSVQSTPPKPFHIVVTTETGSIALDTVNLKMLSMAHNLQASLVIGEKGETPDGVHTRMLLRADLASSELCHGNKVLSMMMLRRPSLYVHFHEHSVADLEFNSWKVAGSCEDLSFDIREEILVLVEVVDILVNGEVSQIYRLVQQIKEATDVSPTTQLTGNSRRKEHWVDLAMSLDSFTFGATLLPSLSYLVRGSGVRFSTRPMHSTEMIIDFDVLYHEHEVRTGFEGGQTRSISVLRLPAINGRVRDRDSAEERLLDVFLSVEAIKLDASSIQSLFNALNKPEVVNVIEEARREWKGTQSRLEEIFEDSSNDTPVPSIKSGTPLVYRAHAGVAGLKVLTSAPSANLEVDLGFIQVHASNRPKPDSPLLALPELHLELRRITVELTRAKGDGNRESCGYVELHASLLCTSKTSPMGKAVRAFHVKSNYLRIDLFAETASTVVDVIGHLQDKLRDLDLSREVKYLRQLRHSKPHITIQDVSSSEKDQNSMELFTSIVSVEMMGIQVSWIVGNSGNPLPKNYPRQNLVLSFKRIFLATATRKENEARLIIEEFLLQMVDSKSNQVERSENSALLPEVVFNVAYFGNADERRFAFQAKGTSLNLQLTSSCVFGANDLEASISTASEKFRDASAMWKSTPTESGAERKNMFGSKRLTSVLVDADFAGAVVYLSSDMDPDVIAGNRGGAGTQSGRFGQFAHGEATGSTVLKSPGLAFKAEYRDSIDDDPSLSAEIKVSASSNTLYPSIVPLVMEMSANVKEIMREPKEGKEGKQKESESDDGKENSQDPAAILGRCKLNVGLRICKQEFTLSCQPIARVAANAGYEEIYLTISTCDESDSGRFYAVSATISGLQTSLQHVYSRESTGHLEVKAVVLSLMSSKHLNGSDGLSCIMNLSPIKSQINLKQFQDFLLFREIWLPEEIRQSTPTPAAPPLEGSAMLVQRYHKVAATKAFPWNTTMAISKIDLQLDLGQSLGKTELLISNFWVTSRKTSDWEQIMCLGFDTIRVSSTGRLSGFVDLKNMQARTSIHWDSSADESVKTPLIQASLGFEQLQVKASFDYQAFLIADIRSFDFLMYNLQKKVGEVGDRLVGVLDGEKVQIFCTTQSASQGLAMYQALLRLTQEKMSSFEMALKDVERYLTRRSASHFSIPHDTINITARKDTPPPPAFLSLHTDVVVNLKEVNIGAFPSTFYDTQVFKLEALNATARFAVEMDPMKEKIHSRLAMKLGQLRISLAAVKRNGIGIGTSLDDVSVEDVTYHVKTSRGGTILIVPHVTASMDTWHVAGSNCIDYTFRSAFEGKVDVGWNYSRVSFIKGMWASHVKAMAQRQGKVLPSSRISINTDATPNSPPISEPIEEERPRAELTRKLEKEKGKITAVVDVPQSKYEYNALEPPVIETPQLRDMGEATPPLEWIGLHRDRLPNLTHQIVIVSLLEVAREVEDAYSKILGSS
ncbi:Macrophage colony-stimulating factor 1 receptor [Rhizina undulata]